MKTIYTVTRSSPMFLIGALVCAPFLLIGFTGLAQGVIESNLEKAGSAAILLLMFALFFALFLLGANRLICRVWVEGDCLFRKGLIGGFYKSVKIADIQRVELRHKFKECDFICFIDGSKGAFDRARKDSYICIPHTKSNVAFVKSFWDGDIYDLT